MNIIIFAATVIGQIVFLGIFASTLLGKISKIAGEVNGENEKVTPVVAHAHGQHQNHAAMDRQFDENIVVKMARKYPESNWQINALTGEQLQHIRVAIGRDLSWLKSKYYALVSKTLSNRMAVKKEEIEQFAKIYGKFQTDYAKLKKEPKNPRQAIMDSEENVYKLLRISEAKGKSNMHHTDDAANQQQQA
jgi:hypothetical protein